MLLRSRKQTTPPLKLIIKDFTKKTALKKKNRRIYISLKKKLKIQNKNVILSF